MARSKDKKVKQAHSPSSKEVRQNENPDYYLKSNPSWQFHRADTSGTWKIDKSNISDIVTELQEFERLTWGEILVRSNNKHHNIDIEELNRCAIDRLEKLKIYTDKIVSLRLTGNHRVYGVLYQTALQILWYDVNHGDNFECVCRSKKKHT